MIFKETEIKGVLVIEAEIISDERGFFARSWAAVEMISDRGSLVSPGMGVK